MGEDIPTYVRRLRSQLGLTQVQLAKALHVTEQTVYNWERGIAQPGRYDAVVLQRLHEMAKQPATAKRAQRALKKSAEATRTPQPSSSSGVLGALIGGMIGVGLAMLLAELFEDTDSRGRSSRSKGSSRRRSGRSRKGK